MIRKTIYINFFALNLGAFHSLRKYVLQKSLQRVNLLNEIGGGCFLMGSASILFDTTVQGTNWIGPRYGSVFFYEYGKNTHAELRKGSVVGIEDFIGSDGIYTE
jgi:hypothetical protein